MKVLLINAVYGHGSTGTIVRDIEQLCLQNGIDCYVASPDKTVKMAKQGYVIGHIIDHKLHALFCRIDGKQAYFSHIATKRLLHYIDTIQPDIVHLHNLHSNYIHLNMLLKYLAKRDIKTIVTLHDCWFYTGGCFHYTAIRCDKWLESCGNCPKKRTDTPAYFKDCSAKILADRKKYFNAIPRLVVTGVSDWMIGEGRKTFFGNRECLTIRNGIDLNVFKPTPSDFRQRLGLEGKYIILGPASKWLLPINKQVLINFVKMMKKDEILLLFGVWSEKQKEYVNHLIQTNNFATNSIQTYGFTKDRTELAGLYTCADVFVNVSREDSLSLINVEAQACGTPVVTFDQTGPKETVDGINSFNVSCGDEKALKSSVETIRTKQKFNNTLSFVHNNFNYEINVLKYIELYHV